MNEKFKFKLESENLELLEKWEIQYPIQIESYFDILNFAGWMNRNSELKIDWGTGNLNWKSIWLEIETKN